MITAPELVALADALDRYGDIWAMTASLSIEAMQRGRKTEGAVEAGNLYLLAAAFRARAATLGDAK